MQDDIISISNSVVYIIYGVIVFLFAVFEVQNHTAKNEKRIIFFLSFLYILILSLKGYVGYDWANYLSYYEKVPLLSDSNFLYTFNNLPYEYGFNFYVTFVKNCFDNYFFFTFVNSVINIVLITAFIRRYSDFYAFSLLVFLVMGGLIFEIDFLRNMKSILLFLLSIRYIESKRFLPYIAINLIGFLFHSSSLVYIPLFFFINKTFRLKIFWIFFLIGNVFFLFQIPFLKYIISPIAEIIGGRIAFLSALYFEYSNDSSYGISIGYLERVSTAILITVFYSRLVTQKAYNLIFINALLYYLVVFFFFGEMRMITLRVPYLFFFSYSILLPQIYQLIHRKINRQLLLLIICLYSILKIHGLTSALMYNYDNILFNTETKEERLLNRDRAFIYLDN